MADREERWHVGKEIPIAVLIGLLIQTGGIIWWAATLSSKMDALTTQITEFRAERYTKNDAQRDQALSQQRMSDIERRISVIETGGRQQAWRPR